MTKDVLTALIVNAIVFAVLFGLMLPVRKLLTKRISAVLQYALWAVVIIKLVVPFGFESDLSPLALVTSENTAPVAQTVSGDEPAKEEGLSAVPPGSYRIDPATDTAAVNAGTQAQAVAPVTQTTAVPTHVSLSWTDWGMIVWAAGAIAVGLAQALCAVNLRRRACHSRMPVSELVTKVINDCSEELRLRRKVSIIVQSALKGPLVMGAVRPLLILPEGIGAQSGEQVGHICLHELSHVKYGDLLVIAALNILRAIYWFNPFVWLCFRLVRADMEAACDARVIGRIGTTARPGYIGTVLQFAGHTEERRLNAAMGMADGRVPMERRIRGMFRQTRTGLKTRVAAGCIALLMLTASILTACQPTPDKPVVVNKNVDLVEEAVKADESPEASGSPGAGGSAEASAVPAGEEKTVAEQLGLSENHMTMELQPSDQVTIKVDADIVAPEYEKIPMVRVKPKNLSQEQFDVFMKYVTGGLPVVFSPMTDDKSSFTKEEISDILLHLNGYKAKEGVTSTNKKNIKYAVEFLNEDLQNAVSKADEKPYEGTLTQQENNSRFSTITQLKCYMGMDMAAQLSLWQSFNDTQSQITFDNNNYGSVYNTYEPYGGIDAPRMQTTYEQALQKAEDFIHAMDGQDSSLTLYKSSVGYKIWIEGYTKETSPQAYMFQFARSFGGAVVRYVPYLYGMNENVDYSKQVSPEGFTVVVDDTGIVSAFWSNYMEYVGDVSGNVPLMDFASIKDIFENYCRYKYTWTYRNDALAGDATPDVTLNVKRVEMNIMAIPEKDNPDSYITVPVWDFIADLSLNEKSPTQEGGFDEGEKDVSILTINAMNGTVIDREQGY